MNDADRFRLLHGPYQAPCCRLGSKLFCKIPGWVTVRRISDGRIQWPMTLAGGHGWTTHIICGDLEELSRCGGKTAHTGLRNELAVHVNR
jgi:hypothetical protein